MVGSTNFDSDIPVWIESFVPQPYTDLPENARSAAISKMLLGMLDQEDPVDLHNGKSVRFDKKIENSVEIHHIFPKAYLESLLDSSLSKKQKETILKIENKRDSVINSMLLTNDTNNIVISDSKPSKYLVKLYDSNPKQTIDRRLERSLIDSASLEYLMNDDYGGFVDSRCKYIANRINQLAQVELFSLDLQGINEDNEEIEEETINSIGIL